MYTTYSQFLKSLYFGCIQFNKLFSVNTYISSLISNMIISLTYYKNHPLTPQQFNEWNHMTRDETNDIVNSVSYEFTGMFLHTMILYTVMIYKLKQLIYLYQNRHPFIWQFRTYIHTWTQAQIMSLHYSKENNNQQRFSSISKNCKLWLFIIKFLYTIESLLNLEHTLKQYPFYLQSP